VGCSIFIAAVGAVVSADAAEASRPNFAVSIFNVYAGLPSNVASVVCQTHDGYVWIGTEGGLARFDGVRFTVYRVSNTPALPANLIRVLMEDRSGSLWIGTQRGLCRYRDGVFERIGLDGSAIARMAEGHDDTIWLATLDKGLWEFGPHGLVSHASDPGMPDAASFLMLHVDAGGRVWFAPSNGSLHYFENGTAHRFEFHDAPFERVSWFIQSAPGTYWMTTEKGVFRLRDGQLRPFGPEQGLAAGSINWMGVDRKHRVWIVTNSLHCLQHPDDDRFITITVPGVENCRSIVEDREGSYWVGSAGDGVARIRRSGFRMAAPEGAPLGDNPRTVGIGRDGSVWAGLAGEGLAHLDSAGHTEVLTGGGLLWSVLPASDGSVWVGTRASLFVMKNGNRREVPEYQGIRALLEDSTGAIWIGAENAGVVRYKGGEFTSWSSRIQALQPASVAIRVPIAMAFAEGADGAIYIGLRDTGGLVTVRGETVSVESPSADAPTEDIRAIFPDAEGNIWLGTKSRGLAVHSQGRWWNPDTLSEPFSDHVSAVMEDEVGRLWLGTPKGIVWAPKQDLLAIAHGEPARGTFRLALASDGVRPGVVGAGSFPNSGKAPDGTLWFATRRGLTVVDPREIALNDVKPPVLVERVMVDGSMKSGTAVELPPGTRSLAIEYTALSFVGPSQVLFRYRLEGRDAKWFEAGTRRTALYADLPPGRFVFHVQACNDDGLWNETGASIAIVQRPFFYQTGWFYGCVALGLMGSAFGVFRWRTTALERRNAALERRIAERTAELARSYETLRASEYFYHSLVESLPQIIVRKDVDGRFTYANAAFAEMVGRPLEQIIGHREAELYPPEKAEKFRQDDLRAMETRQTLEFESVAEQRDGSRHYLQIKKVPLYDSQDRPLGVQILFWDTTTFREIEQKLVEARREPIETSRRAGIAEMATGILHNLGNALNSVNTTARLAADRIRESKVSSVGKVAQLLAENNGRLTEFFTSDARGQRLPGYIDQLAGHLTAERREILDDLEKLQASVDHMKELVASQQRYARVSGIVEVVAPSELIEYAMLMNGDSLQRHRITVAREIAPAPKVKIERQKAVQIVTNLIANAKDAIEQADPPERRIRLALRLSAAGRVEISVSDNGIGIAPENLTRIFAFGFTTKENGHGFGLHSSANAAKEMGGSLRAESEGLGRGATFVLELPPAN
jgi:PAS domain S-box-containing protein